MNEKQPEKVLDSIRTAYAQQFQQKLDERLLKFVVDKEIQKKREAFLQVQISMAGIGLDGLLELKQHLLKGLKGNTDLGSNGHSDQRPASRRSTDVLQDSVRKRAKKALELSLEQANPEEYANLSEEEIQKQKRRAYARAYYHKKKKDQQGDSRSSAKNFKTTPEQRAYQRAYYKRKKQNQESDDSDLPLNHSLEPQSQSESRASGGELFKSELSLSQERSLWQEPAPKKNGSVDYEGLASDRMAIENAFRAEDLLGLDSSDSVKDLSSIDAAFRGGSIPFPKTKLRKAKPTLST